MTDDDLNTALQKLELVAARAGYSFDDILELWMAGLNVDEILELIALRVAAQCQSAPSRWMM
jgi:hypothetical protein